MERSIRTTKLFLLAVLIMLLLAIAGQAQTLGPVISEYGKGKANGQFQIQNNGLQPMTVTIDVMTLGLSPTGKSQYRPLESTTHVKLSETSARLGPKQIRTFTYEVKCDATPCSLGFLAGMVTGQRTADGMVVRTVIPHVVYICQREKGCRTEVRAKQGVQEGM